MEKKMLFHILDSNKEQRRKRRKKSDSISAIERLADAICKE